MSICEYWLIGIAVALVALAFVALTVFSILTLISVRKLTRDIEEKVRALDPYFNVISGVGKTLERFSCRREKGCSNKAVDILECALAGLAVWQKIKENK